MQFQASLINLLSAKLRAFLAVLGVLVGTAAVVALVSSGIMATQHALAQFKHLGTDLLALSITATGDVGNAGMMTKITPAETLTISQASTAIALSAPYTINFQTITSGGQQINASIIGATDSLAEILNLHLSRGRFVSFLDHQRFYCVLGANIAKQLSKRDPIGAQIKVGSNFFTIIGVLEPTAQNLFMFSNVNNSVLIPLSTSMLLNRYVAINNFLFRLQPNADIPAVEQALNRTILALSPHKHLFFRSSEQILISMSKQHQTFTWLLGLIGGIALLVGGIGVMNIMLVSVVERKREIGIRMSIGATRRNISMMFLTEAVLLTVFGGLLGIVVGLTISVFIAIFAHWPYQFFITPVLIGFGVSVLVGIFSGFYPAVKAAKLDPVGCLRA